MTMNFNGRLALAAAACFGLAACGALHNENTPANNAAISALFADEEKYAGGEVGRLEFNFVTAAQDDDIRQVKLSSRDTAGCRAQGRHRRLR